MNTTTNEVIIKLPGWLTKSKGLKSRELRGHIVRTSQRGVLFEGTAVVRASDNCLRCGRVIENPVSRIVGYGPFCSEELGIPRDPDEKLIEEYRKHVESIQISEWLPKFYVEVVDAATGDLLDTTGTTPIAHRGAEGEGPRAGDRDDPTYFQQEEPEVPQRVVHLVSDGTHIQVTFPYDAALVDAIKTLPSRKWDKTNKRWLVPASPDAAVELVTLLARQHVEMDDGVRELVSQVQRRNEQSTPMKQAADLPPVPVSKTDAWLHQRQAFWFAYDLHAAALFMDMGTGKSKVVVDLVVNRQHRKTLILCPKSVVGVWPREFDRHAGMAVRVVAPRRGGTKRIAAEFAAALEMEEVDVPVVCVVNYESAWRGELATLVLGTEWDCVVLDESHKVKSQGGRASMFCGRLSRHGDYRLCLTGTPMPHSPLDVYGQYRFLEPGMFGTSFARFRARYAVMGGYGGHEVLGYQRQEELAERMYRIGFRVMADDVLDLPPVMHQTLTCEMNAKARRLYTHLFNDLFAEWDEGTLTAANALVRLLRLQQVTSGYAPIEGLDPDEEVVLVQVDDAKERLLADTLDDIAVDEPIAIFCRFHPDLEAVKRVCAAQGRRYGELSGRDKAGLTDTAEMSPDIDVIGVQIQSGGVGIDLTRARYGIYYSTGFSLGDYEQSLARVHRPGQTRPTTYYHLEVEDSIDQTVTDALVNRKDVVEFVLGLGK